MTFSRLLVGDKTGNLLAELSAEIDSISWRLSKVGVCKFSMAITDDKAIEDYLKFGNRILIGFDNGLSNWGGMIDPPRDWDGANVRCTAYSGEYLLKYRQTDKGRYFSGATVGYILQALINEANSIKATGLQIGDIWDGGSTHSPDYHFKSLLEITQMSLIERLSTADFSVLAENVDGIITFTINLYARRGADKTGFALVEGQNIVAPSTLSEQGPIVNSWDLAGEGNDWGDGRLTSHAENQTSIDLYGLREASKIYPDVSIQETLDDNAANLLEGSQYPYNMFSLTVANEPPAEFADYDLGDEISLHMPSYGFGGTNTTVRILGREYFPQTGLCALVVQEVT